jgi:protein-S-isoprenylcysteine O-methyltransferase Ste14
MAGAFSMINQPVKKPDTLKAQLFVAMCLHIGVMFVLQFNHHLDEAHRALGVLCNTTSPSLSAMASFTPRFLAGASLMISAALLRMWCYRTLGKFFTFEVAVKKDHHLFTEGPYSYVRHPAYTGGWGLLLATYLIAFSDTEYISVCNIASTQARWLLYLWKIPAAYSAFALFRRGNVEDAILRDTFGATWEHYARDTPYKFIPFIL